MDAEALVAVLQEALPDPIERAPSLDGQPTIFIAARSLEASARALRDHAGLQFAVLIELTAIDLWPREPRFEVTYLLLSVAHGHRLRVKVRLHGADAHLPTVSPRTGRAIRFARTIRCKSACGSAPRSRRRSPRKNFAPTSPATASRETPRHA
jgi:hypothetical protein